MTLISSYINKFKNVRILCVGDVMLDEFVYGKVSRISPEAPVPVFNAIRKTKMLGGAGNVVANLRALNCKTSFVGVVGDDAQARFIKNALDDLDINADLMVVKDYCTTVKTRMIAGVTHLLRADREQPLILTENQEKKLILKVGDKLKDIDVVLLSDYNKGVLNMETTPKIIDLCNKANVPVIIDPKGINYIKYRNATLVKPNLKEFSEATGMTFNPQENNFNALVSKGAEKLFVSYGIQNLIVTLSEHGMLYVSENNPKDIMRIPTVAQEVYDVSGAGDTSMATLGAAIGAKADIKDAMKLANRAAGIVVGKLGTATVSAKELYKAVSDNTSLTEWKQKRKIVSLSQAKKIVSDIKKQRKIVGFTNGCFDCCHSGHLYSLVQAKNNCDVLVVAMNSDVSVKRYKGPERPIQDEKTRALLLASLEFVDYVIVFDEENAVNIVEELKPDIIAKEGYKLENWPEAQKVIEYGGKAIELKRLDGYSTTNLFEKIKGNKCKTL